MNVFVYSRNLTEANAVAWGYVVGGSFMAGCILLLFFGSDFGENSVQAGLLTLVSLVVVSLPGAVLLRRFPVTNVRFYSYYLGLTTGITIPALAVLIRRLIIRRQIPGV